MIRDFKEQDLEQLLELFEAYRTFYDQPSDRIGAKTFLKDRIANQESRIFVCELIEKDILLGFVQLYPLFSSTRMKRLWLLNDLFVRSDFRGKGISMKLIERAKQLVKETDACGLTLETARTNVIGNTLYPKMGFQLNESSNFYEWVVD